MALENVLRMALELPPEERLQLARRLVESVVTSSAIDEAVAAGIRRIEDVSSGRVKGLSEQEYLELMQRPDPACGG